MQSKFVIFVALATLRQSFCAEQSSLYGLSEAKSTQLREIINHQKATLVADVETINFIFDEIEASSAIKKYHLQPETEGISSLINKTFSNTKTATDHVINSVQILLEGPCSAAQAAHSASYADLENVHVQIESAIQLATTSENHTDIRTQLDILSVASTRSLENVNGKIYDAIRTCLNITDTHTLAAIEVRESRSVKGLSNANNAVFDAIKVFAAGIDTKNNVVSVLPNVKVYRKRTISGVRDFVENTYATMRGLHISTHLSQPEIASSLISDQYAQIVSDSRYTLTVEIIFDIIESYLNKLKFGLSDACNDDSSAIDAAQAETAEYFRAGLRAVVDSVSIPDSVASKVVAAGLEFVLNHSDSANDAYFNGIKLARGQESTSYSATLAKIQALRTRLHFTFPNLVRTLLTVVQVGSLTQGLTNHQENLVAATRSYVDNIFAGVVVMAKSCHGVESVSEADFNTLRVATDEVAHLVENFDRDVSSARVATIKSINALRNTIPKIPNIIAPNLNILNGHSGFASRLG